MRNYLYLKHLLWMHMAVLWSASAWAAQDNMPHDLTSIPLGAVIVALGLAFIGGLASTTQKIAKPGEPISNIPQEIFKDIVNSLVAGLLAFFIGAWHGLPPFGQAVFITVAGYGGSLFLDQALSSVLDWIKVRLSGVAAVPPPPSPPGDPK